MAAYRVGHWRSILYSVGIRLCYDMSWEAGMMTWLAHLSTVV